METLFKFHFETLAACSAEQIAIFSGTFKLWFDRNAGVGYFINLP